MLWPTQSCNKAAEGHAEIPDLEARGLCIQRNNHFSLGVRIREGHVQKEVFPDLLRINHYPRQIILGIILKTKESKEDRYSVIKAEGVVWKWLQVGYGWGKLCSESQKKSHGHRWLGIGP